MNIKSKLAISISKMSYKVLHNVFNRDATSLPGKIANKIDNNILDSIADDYEFVIVTGTNGKTLTTSLITKILKTKYKNIITNPSGSNMIQGITTTMIMAEKPKKGEKNIVVLEVDEANVEEISKRLKPKVYVITNIFRDQLDRFGEIYNTYNKIIKGIELVPDAKIIMNADSPILMRNNLTNSKIYYGFNHLDDSKDVLAPVNTDGILSPTDNSILHYHYITYANQGYYFSKTDEFKRPKLTHEVNKINKMTPNNSEFEINNTLIKLGIGGMYNIYNALAAYSTAKLFNIDDEIIQNTLDDKNEIFGRQEKIKIDDKEITIMLIKNPVGTNQIIDLINTDDHNYSLISLLNANYADGIDTSWIFDSEFDKLNKNKIDNIAVGGERYKDMYVRLKMADFENINTYTWDNIIDKIKELESKHIYITATYTAMLKFRSILKEQKYIK